jgi:cation-transporting ATPase I
VERAADRTAVAGLGLGTAALGMARSPGLAGELVLAAVPRAARNGREVFAATAARRLTSRGVVVLDRRALRRLDRVDTVVVSAGALLANRCHVLAAPDADSWSRAERMLDDVDPRRGYLPGEEVAREGDDVLVAVDAGSPDGSGQPRRAAADPDGLELELRAGETTGACRWAWRSTRSPTRC